MKIGKSLCLILHVDLFFLCLLTVHSSFPLSHNFLLSSSFIQLLGISEFSFELLEEREAEVGRRNEVVEVPWLDELIALASISS